MTLDNDTVPPPDYVEGLLRAHEAAPDALIGSLLVHADDRLTIIDGGVHVTWLTAKYQTVGRGATVRQADTSEPQLMPVDVLSGCGTLLPVRRSVAQDRPTRALRPAADYVFSRRAPGRASRSSLTGLVPCTSRGEPAPRLVGPTVPAVCGRSNIKSGRLPHAFGFAMAACPRWALPPTVPMDYARVVVGGIRRYRSGTGNTRASKSPDAI